MRSKTLGSFLCYFLLLQFPAFCQPFGYVDSRLLLWAHPLMAKFDLDSRRFVGTISDPSSDPVREANQLGSSAKLLENEKIETTTQFKLSYANTRDSKAKQRVERQYWSNWKEIEKELEYINKRIKFLQRIASASSGGVFNLEESISPQVETILTDIKNLLLSLSRQNQLSAILDMAAFTAQTDTQKFDSSALSTGKHKAFFTNGVTPEDQVVFNTWLKNARCYWLKRLPENCNNPFKLGFKDLRNDSIVFFLNQRDEGGILDGVKK